MNTADVLRYGHQMVLKTIEDFPDSGWTRPGACGTWSAQDVLAHLTSYEAMLADILRQVSGDDAPTPTLDRAFADFRSFNDSEVTARQGQTTQAVIDEYKAHHAEVMRLLEQVPESTLRQNGVLAWYGENYDLEDFIVYTSYGHKREHCAQLYVQRDRLSASS